MDTDPPEVEARWRRLPFLHAALFALVLWAFLPAVDNDFVSIDDPDYVTANAMVQRGLTWQGVIWAFSATEASNWHPLTWLSHLLDAQFFGLNPAGHHLTSLVLHGVNALLVFALLKAMTGAVGRSWWVAAFFGLHPLRVESVAWIAERKDVLGAMFWLLTMLAYVRWVRDQSPGKTSETSRITHHASRWYWLTLLFFAFGLMCKPMLVTLPFALLLLDVWPLYRFDWKTAKARVIEKLPLFVLSAAACGVTFSVQRTGGAVNEVMSPELRFGNIIVSFVRYLGKLFWPADLAFFYPMPVAWPIATVLAALGLLVAVSALAFGWRKTQPNLGVGWLWYLGTLVPVIGIVAVGQQSIADRYTYIPTLGILIAVVWALHALTSRWKPFLPIVTAAGVVALAICAMLTRQQVRHWKTTETLCRHALAVTRENHLAHDLLGVALNQQDRSEEALPEHLESLRLKPVAAVPQNNLGATLQKLGRFNEAIARHQEAIRLKPHYPEALYNLGIALERTGRFEEAETNFLQAITLRPTYADAQFNLGSLYLRLGRWEDARRQFEHALALMPDSADTLNNLGLALMNLGRFDEAISYFQRAIQSKPDDPRFYVNAGAGFQNKGNAAEAIRFYREALRLQPDHPQARANLEALNASSTNR